MLRSLPTVLQPLEKPASRCAKKNGSMQQEEVDDDSGSPTFINISEEKLIEIFATHEFQRKVTSLKTELSTSPTIEYAYKFTRLLHESLKLMVKRKRKAKTRNHFPKTPVLTKNLIKKELC